MQSEHGQIIICKVEESTVEVNMEQNLPYYVFPATKHNIDFYMCFSWAATMTRDSIAANLGIETDDLDYTPYAQQGGLGKLYQLFGETLPVIIEELNETLAA